MKIYLFCLILLPGLLFSCRDQKETSTGDQVSERIGTLITSYHETGNFDGAVLVADSTGIVFEDAFGLANRKTGDELTTRSMFYLASVSKQFTATAILLLVEEEKIKLDEEIRSWLPELPEVYQGITFFHLLTHTSGIPDYYGFMEPEDGFTNKDVLDVLKKIDSLDFPPGSNYKYSNSGYVLLSILVNRISGQTFAEFLKQKALDPSGLNQTVIFDEFAPPVTNRAVGYGRDSTLTDYRFRTTGGGGIFSNAEELYRWHKSLANHTILQEKVQDLAYQPTRLNNDSLVYYGFGWRIDPENPLHVFHSGELEGFRTFFDRYLEEGIVIILLSNNSSEKLPEMAEAIHRDLQRAGQ